MRTFAQKPKAPQQATPAKSTVRGRAHFGQSHEVDSIVHLQRTIGNQAIQRLLQARIENHQLDSEPDTTLTSHVNEAIGAKEQPLGPETRPFMEQRFGHDFSKVRIHSDSEAANSAAALNARAYTLGSNIVFGDSRICAPNTIWEIIDSARVGPRRSTGWHSSRHSQEAESWQPIRQCRTSRRRRSAYGHELSHPFGFSRFTNPRTTTDDSFIQTSHPTGCKNLGWGV